MGPFGSHDGMTPRLLMVLVLQGTQDGGKRHNIEITDKADLAGQLNPSHDGLFTLVIIWVFSWLPRNLFSLLRLIGTLSRT